MGMLLRPDAAGQVCLRVAQFIASDKVFLVLSYVRLGIQIGLEMVRASCDAWSEATRLSGPRNTANVICGFDRFEWPVCRIRGIPWPQWEYL